MADEASEEQRNVEQQHVEEQQEAKAEEQPEKGSGKAQSQGKGKQRKPEDQLADERYKKQRDSILARKLKSRVKRGSIPWKSSIARYQMDPNELFTLWYWEHKDVMQEPEMKRALKRFKRLGAETDSN
jgi:hypothetical protein